MIWSRKVKGQDQARFSEIEKAIGAVEKTSDAEIVPVIVCESHDYAFYEFRLAIILGLLTFLATLIWLKPIEGFLHARSWDYDVSHLVLTCGGLSFVVMLVVYMLVNLPVLDRLIIPSEVMARRVHERALRAFTESKVSFAKDRLGLLVFVSLLEQRVELLPGKGLAGHIAPELMQRIVGNMSRVMKEKGLVEGILHGISEIGPLLAERFPCTTARENLLADQVTMMER